MDNKDTNSNATLHRGLLNFKEGLVRSPEQQSPGRNDNFSSSIFDQ